MTEQTENQRPERLLLLSWLIIPIIALWLTTGYLFDKPRTPLWARADADELPKNLKNPVELKKYKWDGSGLVTLWFDDAWLTQYSVAAPILENEGMVAALAVPTYQVNGDSYMSWQQIRILQYKGWEIVDHTRTHPCNINTTDVNQIEQEYLGSKTDLEKMGFSTDVAVTPCGVDSPTIIDVAKKNFMALRSSQTGIDDIPAKNYYRIQAIVINDKTTEAELSEWIKKAKEEKKWVNVVFHQIESKPGQYTVDTEKFKKFIKIIKDSELPVVLPSQVLNIVDARGEQN